MDTYLIPVYTGNELFIKSVRGRNFADAKNKIMSTFTQDYDLDLPIDWEDFIEILDQSNILIGEISSIEEFE